MKKIAMLTSAALSATFLSACGGSEADYVLHYTTYSSSTSDQSRTVQRWAEKVEELTDGGIEVRFHYSQSLISADDSLQATLDGRADMAQLGSVYMASDLGMYTVVELPFESYNPEAQMITIQRLYDENETYREEFTRNGVRQLYPLPTGNAVLGLNQPAEQYQDLQGRSIRAGGLTSDVLLVAGANPVAMTATDIYESLERGVISGYTTLSLANLGAFGVSRVTPYMVDGGTGSIGSSVAVINEDLFQSMPEEYQEAILEASDYAIEYGVEELDTAGAEACQDLYDTGAEFGSFSEENVAQWREESSHITEDWVSRYEERGYDAQSVLDDYRSMMAEEAETSDYVDPLVACMEGEL